MSRVRVVVCFVAVFAVCWIGGDCICFDLRAGLIV